MPAAIPIAAAAFSVGAGIAAGATTLVGGLMIAGGALTGIGALTGNKKLMTIGSVLGLAAGGASLLGGAAGASSAAGAAAAEGASATAGSTVAEMAGTAADVADVAAATSTAADTAAQTAALADTAGGLIPAASEAPGLLAGAGAAPAAPLIPETSPWGMAGADAIAGIPAPQITAPAAAAQEPGLLTKFAGWMKDNPELAKIGGGMLQGAMQYQGQDQLQKDAMKRTQAYQDWVRQRYSDSVRNLTVPPAYQSGMIAGQRG